MKKSSAYPEDSTTLNSNQRGIRKQKRINAMLRLLKKLSKSEPIAWGGYGKELQLIDIPAQPWESYVFHHDVEVPDIKFFVKRGYAVIVSDPRGIGKSEGVWKLPFTKQEVQDCYDIIEWAAKEDWCDGNVGMIGLSYFGTIQLLVAAHTHPI